MYNQATGALLYGKNFNYYYMILSAQYHIVLSYLEKHAGRGIIKVIFLMGDITKSLFGKPIFRSLKRTTNR